MGCDIHLVAQTFSTHEGNLTWFDVKTEYTENRHYDLFGWLARVGSHDYPCILGNQNLRGLPDDFIMYDDDDDDDDDHPTTLEALSDWRKEYIDKGETNPKIWMGYHSFNWYYVEEIIHNQFADVPEFKYFVDEMIRLLQTYGPKTRIVFGFDN